MTAREVLDAVLAGGDRGELDLLDTPFDHVQPPRWNCIVRLESGEYARVTVTTMLAVGRWERWMNRLGL